MLKPKEKCIAYITAGVSIPLDDTWPPLVSCGLSFVLCSTTAWLWEVQPWLCHISPPAVGMRRAGAPGQQKEAPVNVRQRNSWTMTMYDHEAQPTRLSMELLTETMCGASCSSLSVIRNIPWGLVWHPRRLPRTKCPSLTPRWVSVFLLDILEQFDNPLGEANWFSG